MLRHAREAAPLVVAAIVVPGALLLSTSWTSTAVPGLDIAERAATSVVSPTATVPSLAAEAHSAPAAARVEPAASELAPALSVAPANQPTNTTTRAAVAAAAALTALALGTAMSRRSRIGP